MGSILDSIGSRSERNEIQLSDGKVFKVVSTRELEHCALTTARCALLCIPLLILCVIWLILQGSWLWTVSCAIGLLLENEEVSPYLRLVGCYFLLPRLVVVVNRWLLRVSRRESLRSFVESWFNISLSLPDNIHIAPIPVPLKVARVSMDKSVLFCLLLIKAVGWLSLKGASNSIRGFFRLYKFFQYLNQQDYNQLLVEAMDLLQERMKDTELTWLYFRHWRHLFQEPFELTSDDSVMVETTSRGSLEDYITFSTIEVSVDQREFDLGWRVHRMCRSVGKVVDKRLSRVENEAHILSSFWANSLSDGDSAGVSDCRTYWDIAVSFLSSFNPATNGVHLLGIVRLIKHQLRVVTAPDKVSVDLKWCYNDILRHAIDRFLFLVMTETVLNAIGGKRDIPLIMDTGASCCISPCIDDFVKFNQSKVNITDLSSTSQVAGEGLIKWKVRDTLGRCHTILIKGYYVPKTSVRLLSSQCLLQLDKSKKGKITQDLERFRIRLGDGTVLDASYGRANLPILPMYVVGESDMEG
jgi:hypothetical protein